MVQIGYTTLVGQYNIYAILGPSALSCENPVLTYTSLHNYNLHSTILSKTGTYKMEILTANSISIQTMCPSKGEYSMVQAISGANGAAFTHLSS